MSPKLFEVSSSLHISTVAAIARNVWNEYYSAILSKGQIDYMLQKFQSEEAISRQIEFEGYRYYLIYSCLNWEQAVGYMAIKKEAGKLFLSKFYILEQFRGNGYASAAFDFMDQFARQNSLSAIWLTVNKGNDHSISVYRHRGFEIVRVQVADIGGGYVMDDYIMEKTLDKTIGNTF